MKTLVLLSGGMDSVTALHWVAQEHEAIGAVSFDYGSKHNAKEIPMAGWQAARLGVRHEVVALDFVNRLFTSDLLQGGGEIPEGHYADANMKRTVVPFRNGIMIAIACGLAESRGAEALVIAAHSGDHAIYPDCRELFMQAMADAMKHGTYAGIKLLRPFIDCDKAEIVRRGVEVGVDFSHTWSCYKGGEIHCGKCGTCVERREAFLNAGVNDPTEYASRGPLPAGPP
jgi:7-cyano-7-deazaguanine synthase